MPLTPDPPEFAPEPDAKPRRNTDWASLVHAGGGSHALEPVLGVDRIRPVMLLHNASVDEHREPPAKPGDDPSQQEAEHLNQLARVLERVLQVLGSEQAALDWLKTPHPALADAAPVSLLHTDAGLAQVLQLLAMV